MLTKVKSQKELQKDFFSILQDMQAPGVHALLSTRRDGSDAFTAYDKSIKNLVSIAHDPRYNWKERNWWLSILTYSHHYRRNSDVLGLNGLWIDADLTENGIDKGEFLWPDNFDKLLRIAGLPQPTTVIDSGHGFYLIYLFSKPVINHAPWTKRVWSKLEDKIIKLFNNACYQMYGAKPGDTGARDFARVLRVPSTNNVKKTLPGYQDRPYLPKYPKVRVVWVESSNRHDMVTYWEDKYLPLVKHAPRKATNASKPKHPRKSQKGKRIRSMVVSVKIPRNRLWQKTRDVLTLLTLRHGKMDHCKENYLFIYACLVIRIDGTTGTIKDIKRLNKEFTDPLPESRVNNLVIEITHDHIEKYHFRKFSTFKHYLHITTREQRSMLNIMDRPEVKRRKRNREHNRKQQRRLIHKKTVTKREHRDLLILSMLKNGHTRKEAAKRANVSTRTVTRIIAKYEHEAPKVTPTRVNNLILILHKQHMKPARIAKRLNISTVYISEVLKPPPR